MDMRGLSFDDLPEPLIPLRFMLTAPVFGLLAACLMLVYGESVWLSRWNPITIAITHSITLGFIASIIMAALHQVLPVICGKRIPIANSTIPVVHILHFIGTLILVFAFISNNNQLFITSMIFLAISFCLYIGPLLWALLQRLNSGATLFSIRLGGMALSVLLILAVLLILIQIGAVNTSSGKQLTNLHASWGLIGWVTLTIMGVSYQVIPMFHVTPAFPTQFQRLAPLSIAIYLILLSVSTFTDWPNNPLTDLLIFIPLLSIGMFSILTLWQLKNRKRKIPDVSINFWQQACAGILILATLIALDKLNLFEFPNKQILYGYLFIFVFVISAIQAMIVKVVPFICYLNLQQKCMTNLAAMELLPHMHQFINTKRARILFRLHSVSIVCVFLAIIEPQLYLLPAISFFIQFSWLFVMVLLAINKFLDSRNQMNNLENSVSN